MKNLKLLMFLIILLFNACQPKWKVNPKAEVFFKSGDEKYLKGHAREAIADYNKAIEIDPEYAAAYNYRGEAKDDLGDQAGAIADFSKAIDLNPELGEAYNGRAYVKHDLGDSVGACSDWHKASTLGISSASKMVKDNCY